MMHFWCKFGKPHFIWFWLIARTNSQAQNGVNLDFQAQFYLEDHCQSPHKTIGILIKVFYISDPNLVILAWTVDELSHGQAHDWRTHRHTHIHTHTHTRRQRQYPKAKTGLGWKVTVKIILALFWFKKRPQKMAQHTHMKVPDMPVTLFFFCKLAKNLQKSQYPPILDHQKSMKESEAKTENSNPTGFWTILLCTFKPNIRTRE